MRNYDSVKNQEIKRRFVNREVFYNVSILIDELAKKIDMLEPEDYEELMKVIEKPDYETAVENDHDCHVQYSKKLDGYVWVNKDTHEISEPFDTYNEACEDCVQENNLDYDYLEIYEHWIVSDFLARKLKAHGEAVGEILGLTVWGRATTGQAICLDYVISKICEELEILEGQRYEWEV